MSTNKNAVLRYNVLDKCFSNFGRKYYFDELLDKVNEALVEDNPESTGIQIRQLRDDIRFMKNESGYSAPIEMYRDGKKGYYRYVNKDFSINNSPLNTSEAELLKNAISVLQRFEGSPEFEWVGELSSLLNDQFDLKSEGKIMSQDSNVDYSGYDLITPLFNATINKRVLLIVYEPYGKEPFEVIFHPHYLKQHNNRWFVLGLNPKEGIPTWTMALDRINSIVEIDVKYIDCEMDWEDYFSDIYGVTRNQGDLDVIELLFTKEQSPYIQTKPLHQSQKAAILESGELKVKLHLIPNYELETLLLSYGDKVRVLGPQSLLDRIKQRLKSAIIQY